MTTLPPRIGIWLAMRIILSALRRPVIALQQGKRPPAFVVVDHLLQDARGDFILGVVVFPDDDAAVRRLGTVGTDLDGPMLNLAVAEHVMVAFRVPQTLEHLDRPAERIGIIKQRPEKDHEVGGVQIVGGLSCRRVAHFCQDDATGVHARVCADDAGKGRDDMCDAAIGQIDYDHGKIVQPDPQFPVEIAGLVKVPIFGSLAPSGDAAARIGHQQRNGMGGLQKRERHSRSVRQAGQLLLEAVVAAGRGPRPGILKFLVRHVQRLLERVIVLGMIRLMSSRVRRPRCHPIS